MREDPMTTYLKSLVSEEVKRQSTDLKEEDAQQIVKALIPEIDRLISEKVKEHFIEIADFIKVKFTNKEK